MKKFPTEVINQITKVTFKNLQPEVFYLLSIIYKSANMEHFCISSISNTTVGVSGYLN